MTPAPDTRSRVDRLQAALCAVQQVDCPVRHYFAPGLFAREITIPAGTCLVGAVHTTENLAILSAGRLRLVTDNGAVEIAAPHMLTVRPGQKNAAVAIETAIWTNFFPNPNDETDINKLIERVTESRLSDLMGGADNVQAACNRIYADRRDYLFFLDEFGLPQETVTALVENTADQTPMPAAYRGIELRESSIHGIGMFATADFSVGELIAPARIDGKRTPAGRFVNHSLTPNAGFRNLPSGDLMMHAIASIKDRQEITNCYRQAMKVNGAGIKPLEKTA